MKIITDKNCSLDIYDNLEYPVRGIQHEDSVAFYIAQLNKATESASQILFDPIDRTSPKGRDRYVRIKNFITNKEIEYIFDDDDSSEYDYERDDREDLSFYEDVKEISIPKAEDGYYMIYQIILPKINNDEEDIVEVIKEYWYLRRKNYITNEAIDSILNNTPLPEEEIDWNIPFYYYNQNQQIVKVSGESHTSKVFSSYKEALEEIIELGNSSNYNMDYNFNYEESDFFSICHLRKCYINLCKEIFNSRGFDRCFDSTVNTQLLYKRDLVWAAINTIKYMIEIKQFAEAQRLIERIGSCGGLCKNSDNDCGCVTRNCGCNKK